MRRRKTKETCCADRDDLTTLVRPRIVPGTLWFARTLRCFQEHALADNVHCAVAERRNEEEERYGTASTAVGRVKKRTRQMKRITMAWAGIRQMGKHSLSPSVRSWYVSVRSAL
jgi:hypothetical protein